MQKKEEKLTVTFEYASVVGTALGVYTFTPTIRNSVLHYDGENDIIIEVGPAPGDSRCYKSKVEIRGRIIDEAFYGCATAAQEHAVKYSEQLLQMRTKR